MMKKAVRIVSLLLVLMLLCSGCGTGTEEKSPGKAGKSKETKVKIDTSVDADTAFELGNKSYSSQKYQEAEAYYQLAIEKKDEAEQDCYGDMANNLVLTYLQQQKNEEAFELCHELLEKKAAPSE